MKTTKCNLQFCNASRDFSPQILLVIPQGRRSTPWGALATIGTQEFRVWDSVDVFPRSGFDAPDSADVFPKSGFHARKTEINFPSAVLDPLGALATIGTQEFYAWDWIHVFPPSK